MLCSDMTRPIRPLNHFLQFDLATMGGNTCNGIGVVNGTTSVLCRRSTILVVELQGVCTGNSDPGSERLRLPTASLTIVFSGSISYPSYLWELSYHKS